MQGKKIMNKLQNFKIKDVLSEMEETHTESDREVSCQDIYGQSIYKIREQVHWKLLVNTQVCLDNKYVLLELIQSQNHFDLYRAISLSNKQRIIVKIIDKSAIKQSLIQNQLLNDWQHQFQQYKKKLKIQNYAQNKLYNKSSGIFLIRNIETFENTECLIKVTEDYYDQTLQEIINKRQSLPVEEALAIIKQVIFALAELHKEGIILTELSPASIIHKNGVFRICDFTSMRKVSQSFSSTLNIQNSYSYAHSIAPQLVVCSQIVNIKSQIWALGILFYQMIAHNVPQENRARDIIKQSKSHHIMFKIKAGQAPDEVLQFIKQLLKTDPDERISWRKLINHQIFLSKQNFYKPKMIPIVDVRMATLKKKQSDIIPEQIDNPEFYNLEKKERIVSKVTELSIKNSFTKIEESKKLNVEKIIDIQKETYLNIKKINLMALKTKYILQQILDKIVNYGLIDKKRRSHIEIMYLISQRCFQYIRKSQNFQGTSRDPRLDNFQQQLKHLFNRVKQFRQMYENQFVVLNHSTYYISNDLFFSFLKKNNYKLKERFHRGQEGLDFTTQQQVKYTQEKCINKILFQMKGDNSTLQQVTLSLKSYQAINQITLDDIEGSYSFSQVVNNIINRKSK